MQQLYLIVSSYIIQLATYYALLLIQYSQLGSYIFYIQLYSGQLATACSQHSQLAINYMVLPYIEYQVCTIYGFTKLQLYNYTDRIFLPNKKLVKSYSMFIQLEPRIVYSHYSYNHMNILSIGYSYVASYTGSVDMSNSQLHSQVNDQLQLYTPVAIIVIVCCACVIAPSYRWINEKIPVSGQAHLVSHDLYVTTKHVIVYESIINVNPNP